MKFKKIDDFNNRRFLTPADQCYYHDNYISPGGYGAGDFNRFILHYKCGPVIARVSDKNNRIREGAISQVGHLLAQGIAEIMQLHQWGSCTVVPVPPSSPEGTDEYDDRHIKALARIHNSQTVSVSVLLKRKCFIVPNHLRSSNSQSRATPDEISKSLVIRSSSGNSNISENIILFDDVITTGATFAACKKLIQNRYPSSVVIGLFIARTYWPASDLEAILKKSSEE